MLAQRFGIELEYEEISPEADRERRRRERLHTLLERATVFYERVLWESEHGAFARGYLASRGLGEEVCRTFRLGYAPGGALLGAARAAGGLRAGRPARRGARQPRAATTTSSGGSSSRSPTRAAASAASRRASSTTTIRCRAKYVNSPESELFRKGDLLYGLDTGRQAIAKEDRAVVVEGNTDVIALRQAGFLPVVASMGTALTPAQLKELARLTRRLFLCFDADAAGQEATLRGMDLALTQGFNVQVVALPKGSDPADDPAAFQRQLLEPVSYPVHRVRLERERARDRESAFATIRTFLASLPDSPERVEAVRLAADLLDLPPETQAGLAPARGSSHAAGVVSPRLLDAGSRLERGALAGVSAHPELVRLLEQIGPEHFDDPLHRRARAHLLGEEPADGELTPLLAELYALAGQDDITVETTEQMLLRLRERRLQRELAEADEGRMVDLQQALLKIRTRIREFA